MMERIKAGDAVMVRNPHSCWYQLQGVALCDEFVWRGRGMVWVDMDAEPVPNIPIRVHVHVRGKWVSQMFQAAELEVGV